MSPRPAEVRRRERHRDARRAILDAAEALLLDEGAGGFTMRKLAQQCGFTAPTIYHYFGDKEGLLATVLEEAIGQLVAKLRVVPLPEDPLDAMRALFAAIVRFGLDNPRHYRLMASVRPDEALPVPSDEEARRLLERPLQELHATGRLGEVDFETVRQSLWALMHGLVSLQTSRDDVEWSDDLMDVAFDAMLRGFLRRMPDSGKAA